MSITYGFYNSLNGDRKYTAEQISGMFEGLIQDGVFAATKAGNAFACTAPGGMRVSVDTGKCWFKNTWLKNDSIAIFNIDAVHSTISRYDAIIIEVDKTDSHRENTIKVVNGSAGGRATIAEAQKPTMTVNETLGQYPIAWIKVLSAREREAAKRDTTNIISSDIEYVVGQTSKGGPPFVTGLIETITIDAIIDSWKSEFDVFVNYLKEKIEDAELGYLYDPRCLRVNDLTVAPTQFVTFSPTENTENQKLYNLGYTYRASVPVRTLLDSATPYITFSLPTIEASQVKISNQIETYNGGFYIYASGRPSANISILTAEFRNAMYSILDEMVLDSDQIG